MKKLFERQPFLFVILMYAVYAIIFFLIDSWSRSGMTVIHCQLDDQIPFQRHAIWLYIAWFPYMAFILLYQLHHESLETLWQTVVPLFTAMFGSMLIYLIWYNGLQLRPASILQKDASAMLVKWIEAMDTPDNVCPSIHVSTTYLLAVSMQRCPSMKNKKVSRAFINLLAIGICLSTMLVKQHSVIDVCAGLIFAIIIDEIWKKHFQKKRSHA